LKKFSGVRSVAAPNIVFHSKNGVLKDGGDRQEIAAFSQRISDEIQINDKRAVSKSMLKDLDPPGEACRESVPSWHPAAKEGTCPICAAKVGGAP